ncbi:rab-GTPase-TBC domain-containing protein [Umbelopsis sp. PMI_123]|nr:rab-GTPase-TBC domain-containing protein [Umbelopsis sp. PMI_123]
MRTITKHTSTNLEQVDARIREALKNLDISEIPDVGNLQDLSLQSIRDFAENGGLGSCVAKVDVLANDEDDLMYLAGERIIVLKHLEKDIYLGYCEGVVGNFNAEYVHFVELDPRVLESLDSDPYDDLVNFAYENRRLSDSWHSHATWQSDHPDGPLPGAKISIYSIASNDSDGVAERPSYSRSSIDSSWTGSSLPSTFSLASHDFGRPHTPWNDLQNPIRSSNSLTRLPSLNNPYRASYPTTSIPSQAAEQNPSYDTSDMNDSYSDRSSDGLIDEYGFVWENRQDVPPPSNLILNKSSMKEYRERELKWLSVVSKMDVGTVEKDNKLKKLVRSGIPASIRAKSWQFLSRSREYQKHGLYQTLLQGAKSSVLQVIEQDVARCYPNHIHFMRPDGEGQNDLRNVLSAYAQYNPDLGYCQGMHCLAGCMLMQMPAEDAFWLLVATVDRYLKGYFDPSLSQIRIDTVVIGELIREHQPKLARHLEANGVTPVMYIPSWFLTAFTLSLPWSSVLRLWDVFYFEGVKVFYRITLAIMEICKDHLLNQCPSNSELLAFLLHIPHKYLGPDLLLETAFRIKLSKSDIAKYARKASVKDASVAGLPFEPGLENLKVGQNQSTSSLPSLKSFSGISKRVKPNRSQNTGPHTLPKSSYNT